MSNTSFDNDSHAEETLLNNNFYSAPTPASHVNTLRNSIQFKHSPSMTSIHARAAPGNSQNEKTSYMKVSPSMKALESILNEKTQVTPDLSNKIVEEDEEDEALRPPSAPVFGSNNPFSEPAHRDSTYSVQSFETARSHNSSDALSDHTNKRSISTIDEAGYSTNDDTPALSQEATFHDYKQVSVVASDNQPKIVDNSSSRNVSGSSVYTSGSSVYTLKVPTERRVSDQDDTLIDENTEANHNTSEETMRNVSDNAGTSNKMLPQPRYISHPTPPPPSTKIAAPPANLYDSTPSTPPRVPRLPVSASSPSLSMVSNDMRYPLSKPAMQQQQAKPKSMLDAGVTIPAQKSPHLRSKSTYSLSDKLNPKENAPVSTRHKRSSTLGDISKVSKKESSAPPVPEKKKFSFKALFKSKSKSHSLNDESKPKKLSSKSYSTSNLSTFREVDNSDAASSNVLEKKKTRSDTSNSILNVFKKNKSSENLHKFNVNGFNSDEQTSQSLASDIYKQRKPVASQNDKVNSETLEIKSPVALPYPNTPVQPYEDPDTQKSLPSPTIGNVGSVVEMTNNDLKYKRSFKSNTKINFIREVTDDDFNPYPQGGEGQSQSDSEQDDDFYDQYDSNNLINNPPTKMSNTRYDEEMSLISSPIPHEQINVAFGSPFDVSYDSDKTPKQQLNPVENGTPKVKTLEPPKSAIDLSKVTEDDSKDDSSLLGEALFPKSLNPQEVESIVSLERSRSMKSIKSIKRNSFVNYTGSDENIIQYTGPPPSSPPTGKSGMTRSNSILKNSTSRRNLNQELYNSIDANVNTSDDIAPDNKAKENTFDNHDSVDNQFEDLMEFTDFIDFDNLSFSNSPKENLQLSPRITIEPPPQVPTSDSFGVPPLSLSSPSESPKESSLESNIPIPMPLSGPPISTKEDIPKVVLSPSPEIVEYSEPVKAATRKGNSPESPELVDDDASHELSSDIENGSSLIETSPILESALRTSTSPLLNENGKSQYNNRPISMSFRGLKGPSFGGKIAQHNIRSSDSHQSFNISFGEDSDVGGGFGTSDDEDGFGSDIASVRSYLSNKENDVARVDTQRAKNISKPKSKSKFGNLSTKDNSLSSLPPPPPKHTHERVPSFTDTASTSSSPKSFGSIISRKWKKSPHLGPSQPSTVNVSSKSAGGVRFSSRIILYDTYNGEEYDRHPDTATCNQLTPLLAQQIKDELNTFKSEMEIHSQSRCYTHFF